MNRERSSLSSRSGNLVESHSTFQPRVFFFYFVFGIQLLVLVIGLGREQLLKSHGYNEKERMQNQRRVIVPGPRGVIKDREGRVLVGNRARFALVLYLDELGPKYLKSYRLTRKNYRAAQDKDLVSADDMKLIAWSNVVQPYLDQANALIGRQVTLNKRALVKHFDQERLLPFFLINDLTSNEYARLIEKLPVSSPLQVYATSVRYYPFNSGAAHALGYVSNNIEATGEDLPGDDLSTYQMKGSIGKDGLEKQFDTTLQGESGGIIFRVDPAGYRINPPLDKKLPVQGKNIITSLDMDIQMAAEESFGDLVGAAVLMDVKTGEVLALVSKPDYDLNNSSPKWTTEEFKKIEENEAFMNRAIAGLYPPGSTFKIITALAGLRTGSITTKSSYFTDNTYNVGGRLYRDHKGCISGNIDFPLAIIDSVNTFFYHYGLLTGPDAISSEAKRFHLNEPTGIELPNEAKRMFVGNPDWKKQRWNETWFGGDTANLSIGQGYINVSPLQMCSFMASFARGETSTKPTLIYQQNRTPQKTTPIGIPKEDYQVIVDSMEKVVTEGTARRLGRIEGLRIAAKTGTAQLRVKVESKDPDTAGRIAMIELAWYMGFAPVENPQVAFAVLVEGDTPDESFGGGYYAAPRATAMLKKWLEKRDAAQSKVGVLVETKTE